MRGKKQNKNRKRLAEHWIALSGRRIGCLLVVAEEESVHDLFDRFPPALLRNKCTMQICDSYIHVNVQAQKDLQRQQWYAEAVPLISHRFAVEVEVVLPFLAIHPHDNESVRVVILFPLRVLSEATRNVTVTAPETALQV